VGYRLLLDEHVPSEVRRRLDGLGHDVEHVGSVPELGNGADDAALADCSARTVVTFDDDFVTDVRPDRYRAVIFFEDEAMRATEVAAVVHAMSEAYPSREVCGLQKAGREWL
jgi:hypothetical protein